MPPEQKTPEQMMGKNSPVDALPPELAERLNGTHSLVVNQVGAQWVRAEADRLLARFGAGEVPAPSLTCLVELLDEPDDDPVYRVHGLLPTGGRVVLAAQYKAGKTTLVMNLIRCLVDAEPFLANADEDALGFVVDQPLAEGETVALFDLELDRRMLRRWLRAQRIRNGDRVLVESFRGRLNELDLFDDERRSAWSAYLAKHNVKVLIVDPLAPLLAESGIDADRDNAGVARLLGKLDAMAQAAGVENIIVVHHMGHTGERARGPSTLRDWPEAEWRLTRELPEFPGAQPAPDAARFFTAEGRDVSVAERELRFDPYTSRLWSVEGNRAQQRANKVEARVLEVVKAHPGFNVRQIRAAVGKAGDVGNALHALVRDGRVHTCPGKYNATHHVVCSAGASCPAPADCPEARSAVEA